jgi:putative transposase
MWPPWVRGCPVGTIIVKHPAPGPANLRYDPDQHHRQSIRLKGYDYSRAGAYFITVCVQQRESLFGEILDGVMKVNPAGQMVERWWRELPRKFPSLVIDDSIVMPNHFHGVLFLNGAQTSEASGSALPVGNTMDWFKTMTTNEYIRGVKELGWRTFPRRLWQRDYFDRIIRDLEELTRIRQYIRQNPAQWDEDPENPAADRNRLSHV